MPQYEEDNYGLPKHDYIVKQNQDIERYNGLIFLNLYLIDRRWGGSEEGGWWYDAGEIIKTMRTFRDLGSAWKFRDTVGERYLRFLNRGRRPVWSILSTGQYQLFTERTPGEDFPNERPHYE